MHKNYRKRGLAPENTLIDVIHIGFMYFLHWIKYREGQPLGESVKKRAALFG
jgi:hypothetical protein